jgi:formylglycine-generating enzyme required for sulfatase activity
VNGQGQTFVVLPGPVEFLMGSPATEAGRGGDESLHRRRIGRTFALATTHVTVEQFKRFAPRFGHDQMHLYPQPDCPLGGVTWYQAAAYCNWLSWQERLPEAEWCYVRNQEDRYAEGMRLAPDYLKRTGYRLPTEAEWEYACRAGAVTSRYYGRAEELLGRYAWYFSNSWERTRPVGGLEPNDLGLFDMHGNLWGWCQNGYRAYAAGRGGRALEDNEDNEDIEYIYDRVSRVLRGDSFLDRAMVVRSAHRVGGGPLDVGTNVGFRPARTFR